MGRKQRQKKERQKEPSPGVPRKEAHPARFLWVVPVLLAAAFNFNVLQNGYGWDDEVIIGGLKTPDRALDLFLPGSPAAQKSEGAYYRPLVGISYKLDHIVWGKEPFGYHLSVWLGHAFNTALAFFLAQGLMGVSGRRFPLFPLAVSSLFAVHPSHPEAVAWIAGRNDVFYTTFVLASFLFYIRYRQGRSKTFLFLCLLFFYLGLLTKEAAAGLIFLFPVFDFLVRDRLPGRNSTGSATAIPARPWREIMIGWIGPTIVLGVYFWIRAAHLASPYGRTTMGASSFSPSMMDAILGFGYYMKVMLWPYPHNPFVDVLPDSPLFGLFSIVMIILLGAGSYWALFRKDVVLGVGITWMVFLAAPAVAATVLRVAAAPVAERYVYGPSAGFLIALCWVVFSGLEKTRAPGGETLSIRRRTLFIGVVLVLIFGIQTWQRNTVWRDHLQFWEATVSVSPEAGFAHRNLGIHYAKVERYDEAEPHLVKAAELYERATGPNSVSFADSLHYLAQLYQKKDRLDEAEPLYRRSVEIRDAHRQENPLGGATLHNLAALYRSLGKFDDAEQYYGRAVAVRRKVLGPDHPDLAKSLGELGLLYHDQGRYGEAELNLEESLKIQERSSGTHHENTAAALNSLAMVYGAEGRVSDAEPLFKRAVRIYDDLGTDPSALAQVLVNQAGLYFGLEKYADSEALLRRAIELQEETLGPGHPLLAASFENYAALLYRMNRIDEGNTARRRAEEIRDAIRSGRGQTP